MSRTINKSSNFVSGLGNLSLSTQSILDVFVIQGLIGVEDADKLKKRYRTNREIERVLLKNGMVSKDTINKAYSILLKLPFVSLVGVEVPKDVINIIPKKLANEFNIVAFGIKDDILQLAISEPSELSINLSKGLQKILAEKNLKLELYITGMKDYYSVFKQYGKAKTSNMLKTQKYPIVYLRNQNIPLNLLGKIPYHFTKQHRLIIFQQKNRKSYTIAFEKPNDSLSIKIVRDLEENNKIKLQVFATSKDDIDYAVDLYRKKLDEFKKGKPKEKKQQTIILGPQKPKVVKKVEDKKEKSDDEVITIKGLFSSFFNNNDVSKKGSVITVDEKIKTKDSHKNEVEEGKSKEIVDESKIVEEDVKVEKPKNDHLPSDNISKSIEKINEKEKEKDDEEKKDFHQVKKVAETPKKEIEDKFEESKRREEGEDDYELGKLIDKDISQKEELKKIISENYVPKTVAAIINFALNSRASDIHIESSGKDVRVRYRIDGILHNIVYLPLKIHPAVISRIKILAKLKLDETRIPQDGRFDVNFKNRQVDVRTSSLPTVHGEKIVMRLLDKSQGVLSLEDLGMEGRAFDLTVQAVGKPYGIILSTGPTGSGKSTTLYAVINRVSVPAVNIITLEDPVEYEIKGINQCQVKPQIGFTFADGLRSVLRQDPNVIMVGEIRDGETAGMATHAALTGHLVLTTLHTNDASGALPRLTNMGIEPFLITSSINVIIAQRLVRRICSKCKEEIKLPESLITEIKKQIDAIPKNNKKDFKRAQEPIRFYHGVGCSECSQGYKGRVGIFEVLRMTPKVEELAIDRRPANEIMKAAIEDGMVTMKQDGILKALKGYTTIDEVLRATTN